MNIYNEQSSLDLSKLSLGNPGRLQGGSYFSKISYDNKPFYLQTSKCDTKNGIITTGKKTYCDLMFTTGNNGFLECLENIEERIKEILLSKSEIWFNDKLDLEDIEYFFNSPIRTYKTSLYLLRTYVNQKVTSLNVYDENQTLRTTDDVKDNIICVINLKGIKFTSQSVHLDIDLKQVMILEKYEDKVNFNQCLIQTSRPSTVPDNVSDIHKTNGTIGTNGTNGTNDLVEKDIILGNHHTASPSQEVSLGNINDSNENITTNDISNEIETIEDNSIVSGNNANDIQEEAISVIDKLDEIDINMKENDREENTNGNIVTIVTDDIDTTQELNEVNGNDISNKYDFNNNNNEERENTEETVVLDATKNLENATTQNNEVSHEENIILEKSETTPKNTYDLEEITLDVNDDEPLMLKKPNEVYYEIYRIAREKAKQAKQAAIIAYLEAKNIKNTYMLESDSESDSDEDSLDDLENMSLSDHELEEKLDN